MLHIVKPCKNVMSSGGFYAFAATKLFTFLESILGIAFINADYSFPLCSFKKAMMQQLASHPCRTLLT